MMTKKTDSGRAVPGGSLAAEVLNADYEKSSAKGGGKDKGRGPLILRIALFAVACVLVILGIISLTMASSTQSTAQKDTTSSVQSQAVAHALVIMSYDASDASGQVQLAGVQDLLGRASISSDVVYLDARTTAHDSQLADIISQQVVAKAQDAGGYDAVIAVGDEALTYVMDNQSLFAGVPTTFLAVDDQDLANQAFQAGIATGLYETETPGTSLKAAVDLLPQATRVVVLADRSPQSTGLLAQLDGDASAAPGVSREVWDVSQMSRADLSTKLGSLGKSDLVLILSANVDADGKVYTPSATAHFVSSATKAPVFSAFGGVGEGVCGASFLDRRNEGQQAATMAVDLLNGKSVAQVPLSAVKPSTMVYDVQALQAAGIDPNDTPESATLTNEPVLSWRIIRPLLPSILLLVGAVVCILFFGIVGFRRSVQSNREIVASHKDLQYRLYHDLLTELPNRHALEKVAADSSFDDRVASVVQLDIDDFTDINDSYGHSVGNEVIRILAQRLENVGAALLVRAGGDEFALVFDHPLATDSPEVRHMERIFTDPLVIGDYKLDISARLGIANREDGMTSEGMIIYSDLALHEAKATRAHHAVFYDTSMHDAMKRKLEITSYLKKAIDEESIDVVWQPQVDTQTLKVYGYEALCRLHDNAYYPNDFIPVAEMSGLIAPLDRVVTKKVIEQLGTWLRQGRKDVGVASINFSAGQLRDRGYCDFLAGLLAENHVPAKLSKIEITESMLLGNEDVAERLFSRLRHMGITLALDDFGTGYSSLSRMANTPVDFVKLDKSLVDSFMIPGKESFIDNITQLVHGLDKKIVVEGVETYDQYEIARRLGCDIIQGYFFSKPLAPQDLEGFNPNQILAQAKEDAGDKTRNPEWSKYSRDSRGRWQKSDKAKK